MRSYALFGESVGALMLPGVHLSWASKLAGSTETCWVTCCFALQLRSSLQSQGHDTPKRPWTAVYSFPCVHMLMSHICTQAAQHLLGPPPPILVPLCSLPGIPSTFRLTTSMSEVMIATQNARIAIPMQCGHEVYFMTVFLSDLSLVPTVIIGWRLPVQKLLAV